ncbi:S9 family peptidase [Cognataquiflexum aquatile]|uniref:S9 family peptidase n=1 Tax=Cognataquiflexum aquatile TaxID=2249427 RepID=UPI000DEB60AC|nr:S9 family peptidase [Cognataquiflexum aquatile]
MKRIISFLPILLLLFSFETFGQTKSNLTLLDLFDLEYVSDPQISPDGSKIIYVRNFKDVMTDNDLSNLWMVNFDGSQNRPLTQGNQRDFMPRWSHDGSKIVFKSNMQDEKTKLFLMWLDTKETVALTNSAIAPGEVSWSGDDKQLAFSMFVPKENKSTLLKIPTKPEGAKWNDAPIYIDQMVYRSDGAGYLKSGNTQIFTLGIDGGKPTQLTFSELNHGNPIWSKDGKSLIFSANLHEKHELEPLNSEVYQLTLADGKINPLTKRFGPDSNPVLSPDGSKIAYLGFDDRFQGYQVTKLYVMNADGTDSKMLGGDLDRDIENIIWEGNSRGIYFQYGEHGNIKIGHVALTGKVRTITEGLGGLDLGRPYVVGQFTVSANNRFAYTSGGTEHPADLGTWGDGNTNRLTRVNEDLFHSRKIGSVEEIWWESSFDKRKVQGWIITPPDFDPNKKYPMILEIHGGPFTMYGKSFTYELQAMAAAGYVVLYTNPRGSTGYGEEFGNLIHHNYPSNDYDDLMSGVDAVIAKGYIDTKNLFVTGGSGGGVLTAWIIGKTDRFKAAVVAKPVINWYSHALYADNPAFFTKYWFPGKPWEETENYMKRSPISLVGNVKTPTMLLTGESDFRTPIGESEQYYAALKLEEVETAMVRIPNASHGLVDKPSMLMSKVAAILSWFDYYKAKP